jgi:hypothetical protein
MTPLDIVLSLLGVQRPKDQPNQEQGRLVITGWLAVLIFMGSFGLVLYAWTVSDGRIRLIGTLGLIGGASALFGGLVGFLFGIPRTANQTADGNATTDKQAKTARYNANTNLEQISDWLTKILVGAGLTQITEIPRFFTRLAQYLKAHISHPQLDEGIILVLIVYFLICGFLFGYLLTRMYLATVFSTADSSMEQISQLVNLDINLDDLTKLERDYLTNMLNDPQYQYKLPGDFKRESASHEALRSLRNRYIIRPKNTPNWQPGTVVELTPLIRNNMELMERLRDVCEMPNLNSSLTGSVALNQNETNAND